MTDNHISPDGQWKWDGAQWVPNQQAATFEPVPPAPKKSRKGWWIAGGIAAALVIVGAIGASGDTTASPEPTPESTVSAIETVVPEDASSDEPTEEATIGEPTEEVISDEPTEEATIGEPTEEVISDEPTEEPTEEAEPVDTTPKKSAHDELTDREMAKLVKDPDAHAGENVIVYAEVTQFDAATGDESFRGSVTNTKQADPDYYWIDGENAFFEGDADQLEDVVADDIVKVWATVLGSFSYDTQNGGSTTVPLLQVNHIDVIG